MAQLAAAERVRAQVEGALTANQVNLASPTGREQAEALIEEALTAYQADALTTNGDGSPEQLEQIRRELRDDLLGLGQLAERKRLDRITPLIEARLPDGSRLTAAIPPISSNGHVIFAIRRFRLKANTLTELAPLGMLSEQAADFLAACVRARKNIVVAGPVSSGKTTLLNALGGAIPGSERVVVCESGAELKLPDLLHNCVAYESRPDSADGLPGVTLDQLVASALRLNPSRILVGECRGPETMAMLWAFATGHAGMTSVHGESADHGLRNLARFALTAGARVEA